MSLVRELVMDAAVGVGIADTPKGLSAIRQRGCAATIWRRQPTPRFQKWIEKLEPDSLPKAHIIVRPSDVRDAVSEICHVSGTPGCAECAILIDDVAALANIFAKLMTANYIRLRFDVISTNACRKFHIDSVKARMICTYRGTGTQYGISTDGAEPRRVFTVPTGAPIILRGTLWPERPRSGLLHRSPPIEGKEETRLLLVIDPANNPEADEFPAHLLAD